MEATFDTVNLNLNNLVWALNDGRYWSTSSATFIGESAAKAWASSSGLSVVPDSPPDQFGDSTEQGLIDGLNFYGLPLGELSSQEDLYNQERAKVDVKYSAPWNGTTGGILITLQMTMSAAQCEVPPNPEKITGIGTEYQAELAAMRAELQAIDEKYGV